MPRAAFTFAPVAGGLLLSLTACMSAQNIRTASRPAADCRDHYSGDDAEFCETRTMTMSGGSSLRVDARQNGGVAVRGWDNNQVQVVAVIRTHADNDARARELAKQISISASGGEVRADGPSRNSRYESWSVSYDVQAPPRTDLSLRSTNGGLSVDGVESHMTLETSNGSIHLTDVNGDVRGRTSNGSVVADLSGDRWRGAGLDLHTNNGSVRIVLPASYSARLETETTHGHVDLDFPVTVQGRLGRSLSADIGSGGAPLRAVTVNGSVSIRRR